MRTKMSKTQKEKRRNEKEKVKRQSQNNEYWQNIKEISCKESGDTENIQSIMNSNNTTQKQSLFAMVYTYIEVQNQ